MYGSDGGRPLTCIILIVTFLPPYIGKGFLSDSSPYVDIISQSHSKSQVSFAELR